MTNISCDNYAKQYNKDDISLLEQWNDCIDDTRSQKLFKTDEERQSFLMSGCCNEVLQCKDTNKWLSKNWKNNKYNLSCPKEKNFPHFGFVFDDKKNVSSIGVL